MRENYFVIDSHCHIYPDKIADRAVEGTSTFYDQPFACLGTLDDLHFESEKAGIDHMIVQSVATTPKQVESINNFIALSVKNSNGKMTGLGTLHPASETKLDDILLLNSLGLFCVKLHPDIQRFELDSKECFEICEILEHEKLILLLHTGDSRYDFSNPNRLVPLLERFKNLNVIGAHFGGYSIWDEAHRKLKDFPNFYVDCSSSFPFISKEKAVKLIKSYGEDKVLFGTDYPMWNPKEELDYFLSLNLTEQENRKILALNIKKLLNLNF